ncbi:RCC1 domain-containing protein [Gordonia sp. PP30]|uniref:RCC1-like domain-containing protein n=1 Tax=Gordonia sp. PP30 TaxID=2935861 RepID=UPI001FFEEEAB|nr:RCC1 domain-containing protein [Gordonia sp. PP30]UQE77007.1 RCC1 domain-containing protein [Gordonia sp. PP30]
MKKSLQAIAAGMAGLLLAVLVLGIPAWQLAVTNTSSHVGRPPAPPTGWVVTDSSAGFSCAKNPSGAVACWRIDRRGPTPPIPIRLPGPATDLQSPQLTQWCAPVRAEGLWCWQVSSKETWSTPRRVRAYPDQIDSLTSAFVLGNAENDSADFYCATSGRTVTCGGRHLHASRVHLSGQPTSVALIPSAAGLSVDRTEACATVGGRIVCWTLSDPERLTDLDVPFGAQRLYAPPMLDQDHSYLCALTGGRELRCWAPHIEREAFGSDTFAAALWNGAHNSPESAAVTEFDRPLSAVTLNESGGCVLTDQQLAYCWGSGTEGQLGAAADAPVPFASPERVDSLGVRRIQAIAMGVGCVAAVVDAGAVVAWGNPWWPSTPSDGPESGNESVTDPIRVGAFP